MNRAQAALLQGLQLGQDQYNEHSMKKNKLFLTCASVWGKVAWYKTDPWRKAQLRTSVPLHGTQGQTRISRNAIRMVVSQDSKSCRHGRVVSQDADVTT